MAITECKKCGWKWNARGKPKRCPNCHDEAWWEAPSCTLGNVFGYRCNVCGYEWLSDLHNPKRCPRCDTKHWDSPAVEDGICQCQRCSHRWKPRHDKGFPKRCPSCKTKYWLSGIENPGPPSCECQKCGHKWVTRYTGNISTKKCPKCGTRNWKP